jgi:hypothetical protein
MNVFTAEMTMPNTEMTMSETQGMTLMKQPEAAGAEMTMSEAEGMTLMKQPEAAKTGRSPAEAGRPIPKVERFMPKTGGLPFIAATIIFRPAMFISASGMVMRRVETVMVATGGSLPESGRIPSKARGMTLMEQPEAAV